MKRTEEQENIIKAVKEGRNVFVDACIGAGKTTTLNDISKEMRSKKILYLTYNKLLKEDAKKQIHNSSVEIHNYHGFVYKYLMAYRFPYTHQRGIKDYISLVEKEKIRMPQYDLILIDEYQDINNDAAELIFCIDRHQNKIPQLVFVGDMKQKIYDTTTIEVLEDCIFKLRTDYIKMDLTNCFRLNKEHAEEIGQIWNKKIIGVNQNQKITIQELVMNDLVEKLEFYKNKDILILTPFKNNIGVNKFVNFLEKYFPEKYNKKNLYITISDNDSSNKPLNDSMIVTTFDGSKGLERKIAVVFGYETIPLSIRSQKGNKEIVRNLFLVAASRGKEEIIFIKEETILTKENFDLYLLNREPEKEFNPSAMFDFVYDEHIDECMETLTTKEIKQEDRTEIKVELNDFNITLAPVMGNYQEAIFFKDWNFLRRLNSYKEELPIVKYIKKANPKTKIKQVLALTAIETQLTRYFNQTVEEFIEIDEEVSLLERLKTRLNSSLKSQIKVERTFKKIQIVGNIDTVKEDVPYELKFVEELEKKHFLQLATYMYLGNYKTGILWNTRFNQVYEIEIKDRRKFIEKVIKTIKKEKVNEKN